jgi:hypothetical protein
VILLTAVLAGLLVGLLRVKWAGKIWQPPELQYSWLALAAFLPQFFAFYLPSSREYIPTPLVAICLIGSQAGLLFFCLLNRNLPGMPVLATGLFLNLLVITANGGFMPLSTQAAEQLIPEHILQNIKVGSRLGGSSKDILLPFDAMVFPWLSDRLLPPTWLPYQFAFSIGDILISLGAFLLLSIQPGFLKDQQKGSFRHVNEPNDQPAGESSENAFRLH